MIKGRVAVAATLVVVVVLFASLAMPPKTEAISVAQLLVLLKQIFGTYKQHVGPHMDKIKAYQQKANEFQRMVLYPKALMDDTVAFSRQMKNAYSNQLRALAQTAKSSSASLGSVQDFDRLIRSGDPNSIAALEDGFGEVFGSIPAEGDAPPAIRNGMDATDGAVQSVFKTLMLAEEANEEILKVADEAETATSAAAFAPGSTSFVQASALVASIESQIMMQRLLAAQLRLEAHRLALKTAERKRELALGNRHFKEIKQMLER